MKKVKLENERGDMKIVEERFVKDCLKFGWKPVEKAGKKKAAKPKKSK